MADPVVIRGFTEEEAPDRADLMEFMTGRSGLTSDERQVADEGREHLTGLRRRFLSDDPAAFTSTLEARSFSTAHAHGILYARNVDYYDAIDEAVRKDTDISSATDLVVAMALRRGWELHPADDSAEAAALRDEVMARVLEVDHDAFNLEHVLRQLPLGKLHHGFSVCETIFRPNGGELDPMCWIHRHPGAFTFNELGLLGVASSKARDGWVPAPYGKFVSLRTGAKYGNPMGESVVDGCQYLYQIKKAAILHWVRYGDRFGSPFVAAKLTGTTDSEDRTVKQDLDELRSMIRNIAESAGVVLRRNQEMHFEARGTGTSGETVHERIVRWSSRETFRVILGAILHVMEAEFGTRAQASEHGQTGDIKVKPLASGTAGAVQRGIINPWIVINRGRSALRWAPRFVIDTDDELAVDQAIKILEAAAKARIPVSLEQAREWLDLNAPESDEDTIILHTGEPPASAAAAPAAVPAAVPGPEFAETENGRRAEAKRVDAVLEATAVAAAADMHDPLVNAMKRWAEDLKAENTAFGRLTATVPFVFPSEDAERSYRRVAEVSLMLAAADRGRAARATATDPEFASPEPEPPSMFADAVRWMLDREVMTREQVGELIKAMIDAGFPQDEKAAERIIRDQVLALAGTANEQVTRRIQSMVAAAVENGTDVADFLTGLDDLNAEGLLPGGTDGYLEMVFRTESGRMYQEQQDAQLRDPAVLPFLWGFQFFNPRDDRSRDTHAAINGLRVRRDSAADIASRPGPPWSYNCRCIRTAVIVPDANDADIDETPGALALVLAIERF